MAAISLGQAFLAISAERKTFIVAEAFDGKGDCQVSYESTQL